MARVYAQKKAVLLSPPRRAAGAALRREPCTRHFLATGRLRRGSFAMAPAVLSSGDRDVNGMGSASNGFKRWPAGLQPLTDTPAEVVEGYYQAINARRLEDAMRLYADECTHHNLAFGQPAVGKKAVREFVYDFCRNIPVDLQFRIDDISAGRSVGVIWHMEIGGVEIPLGKGMSFYQLNAEGKITYVRESPEHFAKFASASPMFLRLTAPFLRNMGPFGSSDVDFPTTLGDELQRMTSAFMTTASATVPSILSSLDIEVPGISYPATTAAPPQRAPADSLSAHREGTGAERLGGEAITDFSGVWMRDRLVSEQEEYDRALRMMGMTGVMKMAIDVLTGMELSQRKDSVKMKYLAGVPNFPEIIEEYQFGEWTEVPRRDFQRGWQRIRAGATEDGNLQLQVELGPGGWTTSDTYTLTSADELQVSSHLVAGDESADVTVAYRRG
mmetsp:Transcript_22845/g.59475  ORF Transcript_22845/g.59475 Transcript_22845/m.59475 type:complete len:444 (-) Transcript_22845:148-1479(-)